MTVGKLICKKQFASDGVSYVDGDVVDAENWTEQQLKNRIRHGFVEFEPTVGAAGVDTSALEARIAELEALLAAANARITELEAALLAATAAPAADDKPKK